MFTFRKLRNSSKFRKELGDLGDYLMTCSCLVINKALIANTKLLDLLEKKKSTSQGTLKYFNDFVLSKYYQVILDDVKED